MILRAQTRAGQELRLEGFGELDRGFGGQSSKGQNMRSVTWNNLFSPNGLMRKGNRTYCVLTIINGSPLPLQNMRGS